MNTVSDPLSLGQPSQHLLKLIVLCILLAGLVYTVFGPTLGHDFVAFDDQNYVYENPEITAGITIPGVVNAFKHAHARNWHPLTTISHMLDCQLFGLNAGGHHLVNMLLHTVTVLLLFLVLRTTTGSILRSAFVAAVFAVHPLRVESVAWIAERKDVLSGVFFMLTVGSYIHYTRSPSVLRYACVIVLFSFGLLSKPTLVITPLLLLLLDFWPLNRFPVNAPNRIQLILFRVFEKLPLLLLSAVVGIVTWAVQKSTVDYTKDIPLATRAANALNSYFIYVKESVWPRNLTPFYPYAGDKITAIGLTGSAIFIAVLSSLAFAMRRRSPYVLFGWCWYLISVLPVIGILQVGLQGHADRYTYLAQIGLIIAFTWATADLLMFFPQKRALGFACGAVVVTLLAWSARAQTVHWKDTEALWSYAATTAPDNEIAQFNIAQLLLDRGQIDAAIQHYEKALNDCERDPDKRLHLSPAMIENGLGNALNRKGLLEQALDHYQHAAALQPKFADAHANAAAVLAQQKNIDAAIAEYEQALAIPPEDAKSHIQLAALLSRAGRVDLALAHYRRALQIAPGSVAAIEGLASLIAANPQLRNAPPADPAEVTKSH